MSLHLRPLAASIVVVLAAGVVGCSSQDPQSAGTSATPSGQAATATASAGASGAPASATSGASPVVFPTPDVISPETLSDPEIEYTVVSIPAGLDATQTDVLMGFINYDRETWLAARLMDGDLTAVESTMTGEELGEFQTRYAHRQATGQYLGGSLSTTVMEVEVGTEDPSEALVLACIDQRQAIEWNSSGEDVTQPGQRQAYTYMFTMTNASGSWQVAIMQSMGTSEC